MVRFLGDAGSSRLRALAYWAATIVIAAESALGGVWDVMLTDYVRDIIEQDLGYPLYVAVIIGVCKIPGAAVLVVPGFPRLKEWVYAGVMFIYLGAVASHAAVGDFAMAAGPLGFAAITMVSWALRPASRRDPGPLRLGRGSGGGLAAARAGSGAARARTLAFWGATGVIAFVLAGGGAVDLIRRDATVDGMVALGYPVYFLTIIGTCKVLGAVALCVPRFQRLKEWAYAGAFYNFAGAFTSHLVSGSEAVHVFWTGLFAVLTLASWALRPDERVLGAATGPADDTSRRDGHVAAARTVI